jgi:hypothetical protein
MGFIELADMSRTPGSAEIALPPMYERPVAAMRIDPAGRFELGQIEPARWPELPTTWVAVSVDDLSTALHRVDAHLEGSTSHDPDGLARIPTARRARFPAPRSLPLILAAPTGSARRVAAALVRVGGTIVVSSGGVLGAYDSFDPAGRPAHHSVWIELHADTTGLHILEVPEYALPTGTVVKWANGTLDRARLREVLDALDHNPATVDPVDLVIHDGVSAQQLVDLLVALADDPKMMIRIGESAEDVGARVAREHALETPLPPPPPPPPPPAPARTH